MCEGKSFLFFFSYLFVFLVFFLVGVEGMLGHCLSGEQELVYGIVVNVN